MFRFTKIVPTKFVREIFINRLLTIYSNGAHRRCLSEVKYNGEPFDE